MDAVESLFKVYGVYTARRFPFHCSRICRRVNMCSPQDLPFLNPACSLRSIWSRAVNIMFRIALLNTLQWRVV